MHTVYKLQQTKDCDIDGFGFVYGCSVEWDFYTCAGVSACAIHVHCSHMWLN